MPFGMYFKLHQNQSTGYLLSMQSNDTLFAVESPCNHIIDPLAVRGEKIYWEKWKLSHIWFAGLVKVAKNSYIASAIKTYLKERDGKH